MSATHFALISICSSNITQLILQRTLVTLYDSEWNVVLKRLKLYLL
uniref:Uncharacterized protein n=1 Tax=Moniliophthora roreri TaxID=221103 RepID=A0A0W0FDJ0_MONRR